MEAVQLKNFLPPDQHAAVLDWALSESERFKPSLLDQGVHRPDFRVSSVCSDLGPCKDILRDAVKPRLEEFASALGVSQYPLSRFDAELAAHNDGAFYKCHVDVGAAGTSRQSRLISVVYYFHRLPKGFSGGELRLFSLASPGTYSDFEPEDNSIVAFPAFAPHEVRRVECPSRRFEDSRFAINLWAHRALAETASTAAG